MSDGVEINFPASPTRRVQLYDHTGNLLTLEPDGSLPVTPQGTVSTLNSTADTLDPDEVFTGEAEDVTNVAIAYITVKSDVASAIDGLSIQQSSDGVNWDHTDEFTISAGSGKTFSFQAAAQYFRIVYTNGSTIQSYFRLQTLLKSTYGKPSSHRVADTISDNDDSELVKSVLTGIESNGVYQNVSVQYPLPADSNSVYAQDIDFDNSDFTDWAGDPEELFKSPFSASIVNSTTDNPKQIILAFRRTVNALQIGFGENNGGDFSNLKVSLLGSGGATRSVFDESTDNTDLTSRNAEFENELFNSLLIEFHTADTVSLSNITIQRATYNTVQIQGLIANDGFVTFGATESGNLKTTDAESILAIAKGDVVGHSIVYKFGKNEDVGTSFAPLSIGGVYQTPQVSGAITLRVRAGDANDTAAGSGARLITVQGLDETGALVSENLVTNGATAGVVGTVTWLRVFRAYVAESGTYATAGADSCAADIVVETTGGVAWLTIHKPDICRAQSQIGQYTVPLGKTAYVSSYLLTTDSNKAVDFLFFKREGVLDTAPPYQARRTVIEEIGVQGHLNGSFEGGQKFTELTDIGWMVKAAASAEVTVDFQIILVDN